MSRARPAVDDAQLTLDVPEWRWKFRVPVVETSGNNHRNIVHWPDLAADEPQPACKNDAHDTRDVDWVAKEFCGGLAAFRRPCFDPRCIQPLVRKARDLEVEFDG